MYQTSSGPASISRAELMHRRQEAHGNFQLCCSIGSIAGMAGKLVEQPFDTIKVRLQTQRAGDAGVELYRNSFDCFRKIVQREGPTTLYRGLPSPMIAAALENAAVFGIYGTLKHYIIKNNWGNGNMQQHGARSLSTSQSLAAGAATGVFTGVVLTPAELIKCRMQAQRLDVMPQQLHGSSGAYTTPYRGTWDCLVRTVRAEGPRGLFRGGASCILREVPGTAMWFSAYELTSRQLSTFLADTYKSSSHQRPSAAPEYEAGPLTQCVAGAVAGCLYWLVPYPIDTIKTRVQAQPEGIKLSHWEVFRDIIREEGARGLYKGIGLTMVRAVPASAAVFFTYEQIFSMIIAR